MLPVLAWDTQGEAPAGWGSHIILPWDAFEPAPGAYKFDLFSKAIAKAAGPVYLQLAFSLYYKEQGVPLDRTPGPYKRSLVLNHKGKLGQVPPYDADWTAAYNRAVAALARRFGGDPQVRGYWHAAGWGQETQAAVNNAGGLWADLLKPLLPIDRYLAFLTTSTRAALDAWQTKPVYLPGAPSPGGVWGGSKRRDVIAALLEAGAGYMNCGLATDNSNSEGIGASAGLGQYDITRGRTTHVGFEEGHRSAPHEPREVYWWLLRALHHDADFVNLYRSISAPDAVQMWAELPAAGTCWLVFRAAEYPERSNPGSDGQRYGHRGEPGPWGDGRLLVNASVPHELVFQPESYRLDRWAWQCSTLELVIPECPTPQAAVTSYLTDGEVMHSTVAVVDGALTLPGGSYHRVDVQPVAVPPTLEQRMADLERRVTALEGR